MVPAIAFACAVLNDTHHIVGNFQQHKSLQAAKLAVGSDLDVENSTVEDLPLYLDNDSRGILNFWPLLDDSSELFRWRTSLPISSFFAHGHVRCFSGWCNRRNETKRNETDSC